MAVLLCRSVVIDSGFILYGHGSFLTSKLTFGGRGKQDLQRYLHPKELSCVVTSQVLLSAQLMFSAFEFPVVASRLWKYCGHLEFLFVCFLHFMFLFLHLANTGFLSVVKT